MRRADGWWKRRACCRCCVGLWIAARRGWLCWLGQYTLFLKHPHPNAEYQSVFSLISPLSVNATGVQSGQERERERRQLSPTLVDGRICWMFCGLLSRPCSSRTSTSRWAGATMDTSAISRLPIRTVRNASFFRSFCSPFQFPPKIYSTPPHHLLLCFVCTQIIPGKAYLIHRRATPKWTTPFHQIVTVISFFFLLFFHFFFYPQKFIKKKDMRKQTTATKRNRGHVYGGRGWPTRYGGIGCGNWSCRFSFPLALVFCLFMYTCDIVSSPQTKQQKRKGMEKDYKPLSPSSLSLRPEENFAAVTNSGYDRWFCQVYSWREASSWSVLCQMVIKKRWEDETLVFLDCSGCCLLGSLAFVCLFDLLSCRCDVS